MTEHELGQAWGPTLKQAVAKKDRKPVEGQGIRRNYYEMGDGIEGLKMAIKDDPNTKGDRKLFQLVGGCEKASDALYKHLEATYNWD